VTSEWEQWHQRIQLLDYRYAKTGKKNETADAQAQYSFAQLKQSLTAFK
jgi:hypothetical protein